MRKITGIIVVLLISLQVMAVGFEPVSYSAPSTDFRSTSAYNGSMQPIGSMSAISAANYQALNSEGGANYTGGNGPRRGRPQENDYGGRGSIGSTDFHSPVGEIPWIAMGAMLFLYVFYTKKRKNAQKV